MRIGEQEPGRSENKASVEKVLDDNRDQEAEKTLDVPEVAKKESSDIAAKQEEIIEAAAKEFENIKSKYGPDPEITAKYGEKIESLATSSRKIVTGALKKIRKIAIGYSMLVATAGSAEGNTSFENKAENPQTGARIEESQREIKQQTELEKAGIELVDRAKGGSMEAKAYKDGMDDLEESVFFDDHERYAVCLDSEKKEKVLMGVGNKDFINVSYDSMGITEALKDKTKKIEIVHSHPISGHEHYQYLEGMPKDHRLRRAFKEGRLDRPLLPPSPTDFIGLIKNLNNFGEDSDRIENRVVDPSGEWTLRIDKDSSFVRGYSEYLKYASQYSNPDFLRREVGLSDDQVRILKKKNIYGVHPEKWMKNLKSDPETSEIASKIEEKLNSRYSELLNSEDLDNFERIFSLKIYNYKREDGNGDETKRLIEEYIETAKKIGINIEYNPKEK